MGISVSCPFAEYNDLENGFESVIVKSISLGNEGVKTNERSISFRGRDSDPTIVKSLGSGKMVIEGSVSFNRREKETTISIKVPAPDKQDKQENMSTTSTSNENKEMDNQSFRSNSLNLSIMSPGHPKHEAALKLQKVYKSFRTRRKLADCAVLVEQSWWKLLDFAELKRSSISFFEIEKHETAISRWSRARTRAAKVGKGLSKNDKAQKLALQHWLEAIDPRHRYGHNLHFYYVKWLHCQSNEPFFYWLDIGEGKEVNLEKCPRSKLQQQCIKYLGPMERKGYEVVVEDGKFLYKQTGELIDTIGQHKDAKWIFVLSTSKNLYVGKKKKGTFQHSSFLAGGATSAAGRLVVENGTLKAVWPHSGHYRPTQANFLDFISFLEENNVDLTDVKMSPVDEEENSLNKQSSGFGLKSNSSEEDLTKKETGLDMEKTSAEALSPEDKTDSMEEEQTFIALEEPKSRWFRSLTKKLSNLEIPKAVDWFKRQEDENLAVILNGNVSVEESPYGGYETAEAPPGTSKAHDYTVQKQNFSDEEHEENETETVPEESILRRINSHKEMKSFQLGKQLSCRWTTGAGPRIGCVRDYPSELQFRALEQVNLSPRSAARLSRGIPSSASAPSFDIEDSPQRSNRYSPLSIEKSVTAAANPS